MRSRPSAYKEHNWESVSCPARRYSQLVCHAGTFQFQHDCASRQTVLFNTQMHSKTPLPDGMALYAFEQTPPVSTYLAAFVVGSLTNVSAIVPGTTPFEEARTVSIWGTPHR